MPHAAACYDITKSKSGNPLFYALSAAAIRLGGKVIDKQEAVTAPAELKDCKEQTSDNKCDRCGYYLSVYKIGQIIAAGPDDNIITAVANLVETLNGVRKVSSEQGAIIDGLLKQIKIKQATDPIGAVFEEALTYAQTFKDCHQNHITESQHIGPGFLAGQARVQILDALRCHDTHKDKAASRLLGAIVTTAALLNSIRNYEQDLAA